MHTWYYDEYKSCGVDYSSIEQIKQYDANHSQFRNFDNEAKEIINDLLLNDNSIVADIGCGTAAITNAIAQKVKKIYAFDVSKQMIEYARHRYPETINIEYICSGFLGLQNYDLEVDAAYTKMALHHLPDFWKQIAFRNLSYILKHGGKLLYVDVIFSGDIDSIENKIIRWIDTFKKQIGEKSANEVEIHIKEEFSTFDWVIEKMLTDTHFTINNKVNHDDMIIKYICTKG